MKIGLQQISISLKADVNDHKTVSSGKGDGQTGGLQNRTNQEKGRLVNTKAETVLGKKACLPHH